MFELKLLNNVPQDFDWYGFGSPDEFFATLRDYPQQTWFNTGIVAMPAGKYKQRHLKHIFLGAKIKDDAVEVYPLMDEDCFVSADGRTAYLTNHQSEAFLLSQNSKRTFRVNKGHIKHTKPFG